jgi:outer membrane protein, heavy metal efflux system
MKRCVLIGVLLAGGLAGGAQAQKPLTWAELRAKFQAANPNLIAGKIGIDESKANEVTAFLRPNPDMTAGLDQFTPFTAGPYRPLTNLLSSVSFSYLHERQNKRELRLESAQKGTAIALSQQADLERTLLFSLRGAFVQTLQAKAVVELAKTNLADYDRILSVSEERFKAGDIAQMDLDRLVLQRVQFESDLETADVNLRTAKIQLLMLMNDRTPVEKFDVTGPFEFNEQVAPLEEFRRIATDTRPDLKAALQAVDKAQTDHKLAVANGSTDPTFGVDTARNPPITAYIGFNISIPLRIFDKNQGEKVRTELDIRRNERLREATEAQVFSDVDSAYAQLNSNLALLRPYKAKYLQLAVRVRDTVSFSYQHGGASLLDFINAQNDYRSVQLNYLNLIGSYLTSASQLNLAVGREVIQ